MKNKILDFLDEIPKQFLWAALMTLLMSGIIFLNDTIFSLTYWNKWKDLFKTIAYLFLNPSHAFASFFIVLLFISLVVIYKVYNDRKKLDWVKKVHYDLSEHTNLLISHLISKHQNINSVQEFKYFLKDTVDSIHSVYKQNNPNPIITWFIPDNATDSLLLKFYDAHCEEVKMKEYHSFKKGEGVAGKSWESGELALYAPEQENSDFKQRNGCNNSAYMCCPIGGKAMSEYGIIGIGYDFGKRKFSQAEKENIKLIANALYMILEVIDEKYKSW